MTQPSAFPPVYEYALAHCCSRCGAEPGLPCDAPRKHAAIARRNEVRALLGQPPAEPNLLEMLHSVRVDAGIRHRYQDIGAAPWPEDREPGRRYDTLATLPEA